MQLTRNGLFALVLCIAISGCETIHSWETCSRAIRGKPIETAFQILGQPTGQFPTERGTAYVWTNEEVDFKTRAGMSEPTQGVKSMYRLNVNRRGIIFGSQMRQLQGELYSIQRKLSEYADQQGIQPVPSRMGTRLEPINQNEGNMPPMDGSSRYDGRGGK